MLSAGRDGSNLFVDYLNSIPGVSIVGEVLNEKLDYGIRDKWITKGAAFRHIRRSLNACDGDIRGLKIHFAQLRKHKIGLDELHNRFPRTKFIVLYRQSLARQYVSSRLAAKTGQWLLRDKNKRVESQVRIEREGALRYYERNRDFYRDLLNHPWVKKCSILFSYEELTQDPQGLFDTQVVPFLNLPTTTIKTTMSKQNTKELSELIENYTEVEDILTGDQARHSYTLG